MQYRPEIAVTTVTALSRDQCSTSQAMTAFSDATGFHCPTHGDFKVADTVFAEDKAKHYTREQWEAALDKAKERAEPDSWPLVITDDFF